MKEVITLEWDNWLVNKWEERDKGENLRERSQERAKGEYQKKGCGTIQFSRITIAKCCADAECTLRGEEFRPY